MPADAAAAFVDDVLGSTKHQRLAAVEDMWTGLRLVYPTHFAHNLCNGRPSKEAAWLPYGSCRRDVESNSDRDSIHHSRPMRRRSRSRSPSVDPAPVHREIRTTRPSRCGVLFHCVHGTSRSAVVLAAVMLHRRLCTGASWLGSTQLNPDTLRMDLAPCNEWSFAAGVVKIVQLARPQVQPNAGFLKQLHDFHMAIEKDDCI